MPVIVPLVTVRFVRVEPSALSVAIVPRPNVVRCAAALKSSSSARPAAVQIISSITPAFALLRPNKRSVAVTFWTLEYVIASSAIEAVPSFVVLLWSSLSRSMVLTSIRSRPASTRFFAVTFLVSEPLMSAIGRTSAAATPALDSSLSCVIRWSAKAQLLTPGVLALSLIRNFLQQEIKRLLLADSIVIFLQQVFSQRANNKLQLASRYKIQSASNGIV